MKTTEHPKLMECYEHGGAIQIVTEVGCSECAWQGVSWTGADGERVSLPIAIPAECLRSYPIVECRCKCGGQLLYAIEPC